MKLIKRIAGIAVAATFAISMCNGQWLSDNMQPLTVEAESYSDMAQYGENLSYRNVDEDEDGTYDYVIISHCNQSATEVEIPSEINGLPVTGIGNDAFSCCASLTSIEIPESITSIGDWAFNDCTSLTSIKIPESVTSIGECTFKDCENLTNIKIPESITSIGYSAFSNCASLIG